MYMYKKKSNFKNFIIIFLIIILSIAITIIINNIYDFNLQMVPSINYTAEKTSQGIATSASISEIIEKTTSCVVGISKIKNTGNSIFLNNAISELGIGTGVIVSENGYIVTNHHVSRR